MKIEFVEQEVVERLPGEWCGQRAGRKIRRVVGDDHVGSAGSCCGDNMPVVGVG
ncbi:MULTISPECIES: hypothetical protein [Protofrankia]|uniref:hypothetical protein n=1 Tax=Protofrankia TaxID=2994361 RepID=UPI0002F31E10|nr:MULTISPECIES: hypothetical protein [Protofrankia]